MPVTKSAKRQPAKRDIPAAVEYAGKKAKTGNSLGFRFDKSLFKSHPEFNEVRAHVIGPGAMLVTAVAPKRSRSHNNEDPILGAFLSFLAQDIMNSPETVVPTVVPLDNRLAARIHNAVGSLSVDPNEDLGDEPLL